MQPMLAYRFLRKVSDWTMDGFYAEVYVTGYENVPRKGPVILAPTHHNEIIDIAALSVTIPYRRQICYWAKSTMFKSPLVGVLLRSSGSIPVHRNPNNLGNNSPGPNASTSQAELFRHTSAALAKGGVVGVFPEGTSYTAPGIVQVKEGAAWAAVEYVKAIHSGSLKGAEEDLLIVPAAVVYTDKSQYQSRVYVRYGKPIPMNQFFTRLKTDDEESARRIVKQITAEIFRELKEMTINAPDWDTLYAASMARNMVYKAETLRLDKYINVTQSFVDVLLEDDLAIRHIKAPLVKYLGLLHYTGITHEALDYLYPLPSTIYPLHSMPYVPTVSSATVTFLFQLCKTAMHPNAIAFVPIFIIHLPVYIIGTLAARLLAKQDEEEAKAQFKAVFGGLGLCFAYGSLLRIAIKWLGTSYSAFELDSLVDYGQFLSQRDRPVLRIVSGLLKLAGLYIVGPLALWRWHSLLIRGNLERWSRLSASVRILAGLISPTSLDIPETRLEVYSRPPPPAENPFIKRQAVVPSVSAMNDLTTGPGSSRPPQISSIRLVRPLLAARMKAAASISKVGLVEDDMGRMVVVSKRN